jgi:hypothetical protein
MLCYVMLCYIINHVCELLGINIYITLLYLTLAAFLLHLELYLTTRRGQKVGINAR